MATLTGRVVSPGDPEWDKARRNFNGRFDVRPRAVVYCGDVGDVVNAVRWAREHDVPLRARSGGHSAEGYSLVDGGLIIDVSAINDVRVHRDGALAKIGAGTRMLACAEGLGEADATIPLGLAPTVGLAGLVLGGGFGLTSRKFGLTCDNLLEVEIVTASGEILRANARTHPDLFWACRGGGGGNFGVATEFLFRLHPVSLVVVFIAEWSWDQFDRVVAAWQIWGSDVDDRLSAGLQLTAGRTIGLCGLYTPDDPATIAEGRNVLAPLFRAVPPTSPPTVESLSFIDSARIFFTESGRLAGREHRLSISRTPAQSGLFYKSTSAIVLSRLPVEAIAVLRTFLETPPKFRQAPPQPPMVHFILGGGAPARVGTDATAVYHLRKALFTVEYDGYWADGRDAEPMISWIGQLRRAMQPYTRGAYVNAVDSGIEDPLRAYYGPNLERLVSVKRQYDPDNRFHFPQSIPLSLV